MWSHMYIRIKCRSRAEEPSDEITSHLFVRLLENFSTLDNAFYL